MTSQHDAVDLAAAMDAEVDRRFPEFLERLIGFASIPGVSATGEAMREAADYLCGQMRDVGLAPRLVDTGPYPMIRAEAGEGEREVIVYGHYDVVPADPDGWRFPPFTPTISDGALWGRGVGDNKGQLLTHLFALSIWDDLVGTPPGVRLKYVFEGEDEIGCPRTAPYIRAHPDEFRADVLWVTDASTLGVWSPAYFLGMRGCLFVELRMPGPDLEWHSGSYGGILPNSVSRLAAALGTIVDAEGRVAIAGFYESAIPPSPALREAAARLPADFLPPAAELGIPAYCREDPVGAMFFEPRACVSGFSGGYTGDGVKLVVPTTARAKIDFSLQPGQRPEVVLDQLRRHLAAHGYGEVDVVPLSTCPPSWIDPDHWFVGVVAEALEQAWGEVPYALPSIGGGGVFASFTDAAGVPCLMVPYGQPTLQEHSSQEHFDLDWFSRGIKSTLAVLRGLSSSTGTTEPRRDTCH